MSAIISIIRLICSTLRLYFVASEPSSLAVAVFLKRPTLLVLIPELALQPPKTLCVVRIDSSRNIGVFVCVIL